MTKICARVYISVFRVLVVILVSVYKWCPSGGYRVNPKP